jgi:hypothetical protein
VIHGETVDQYGRGEWVAVASGSGFRCACRVMGKRVETVESWSSMHEARLAAIELNKARQPRPDFQRMETK